MVGIAADCCVPDCCGLDAHPRQKKRRVKLALVAIVFNDLPKIHPKGIKFANPKTLQPGQKGGPPAYWVERYRGKGVTTVTQLGCCVFHFRVSEAQSPNCRHKNAYTLQERK
jgi:hypothetical protein